MAELTVTVINPPSPPSLPIIGHLHLLIDMPHHTFTKLAQKLGPIIYLQLCQVPTVIVSSPRLTRLILKTHDHVFSNRPQLVPARSKRVNSFQLIRDEEASRLLTTLSAHPGSEVNVSGLFLSLANDILCRVAFGRRLTERVGSSNHLAAVLRETQELFAGMSVGDFFPEWEWVHSVSGYKRRLMKNLNELRRVCDEVIKEHLQRGETGIKEDFVDVLLRVQKQDNLEVPITDDNLKALVLEQIHQQQQQH
ncbi:hypothetical protein CXB51_025001 [Gossypium anomalum]|uniref:Uncharacterized protein n=1 Tax=Gossypium anomalum TaxID=47600 RepID=A0A8J6CM28_9ROSI|nr:hypothetical protein CXB51_025001 [Gossypium anomalum]